MTTRKVVDRWLGNKKKVVDRIVDSVVDTKNDTGTAKNIICQQVEQLFIALRKK